MRAIQHVPDDGWSGRPKHGAVYIKRLLYWICMVVFGRIINILLGNEQPDDVTQEAILPTPVWGWFSHHHHHHHKSFMELGHLLTRFGLTYPEVSSKFYHDSFCQLGSSISLPWVIYFEALYLHVVPSFSSIPLICPNNIYIYTGSFKKIWTSSTLATEVTGPDTLWFFPMGIR